MAFCIAGTGGSVYVAGFCRLYLLRVENQGICAKHSCTDIMFFI